MTFMWNYITNTKPVSGYNFSNLPLISKRFCLSYWQIKSHMNIQNIFCAARAKYRGVIDM